MCVFFVETNKHKKTSRLLFRITGFRVCVDFDDLIAVAKSSDESCLLHNESEVQQAWSVTEREVFSHVTFSLALTIAFFFCASGSNLVIGRNSTTMASQIQRDRGFQLLVGVRVFCVNVRLFFFSVAAWRRMRKIVDFVLRCDAHLWNPRRVSFDDV